MDRYERLLRAVIKALDTFRASIHKNTEAIREQNEAANRQNQAQQPPVIHATLRLPVEVDEYCRSQTSETQARKVWRWIKNGLEATAVFAAVGVAIFTYKTLRQVGIQTTN